jgi:hypothetical protein
MSFFAAICIVPLSRLVGSCLASTLLWIPSTHMLNEFMKLVLVPSNVGVPFFHPSSTLYVQDGGACRDDDQVLCPSIDIQFYASAPLNLCLFCFGWQRTCVLLVCIVTLLMVT